MNFRTPTTPNGIQKVKMPEPNSEGPMKSSRPPPPPKRRPSLFPVGSEKSLKDQAIDVLRSQLEVDPGSVNNGAGESMKKEAKNSLEVLRTTVEKNDDRCVAILAKTSVDSPFPEIRVAAREIIENSY